LIATNGGWRTDLPGGLWRTDFGPFGPRVLMLVPPDDTNVYQFNDLAALATNLPTFLWTNFVGRIFGGVLPGGNVTVVTNNAGQANESVTLTAGAGSQQTNWSVASVTNAGTSAYSNAAAFELHSANLDGWSALATSAKQDAGNYITALTGDVTASGPGSAAATLATVATPGTSTKVTYNAKGLVTSGTTLSAGDVPTIAESQVTSLVSDLAGKQAAGSYVTTARAMGTTAPLSGGGDLSADRTLSIPKGTGSVDGYLAAADFTTFSGKQDALGFTAVPATRTLTIDGTAQDLSANRSWSSGPNISAVVTPGSIVTNGESQAITVSNQWRIDKTHALVISNATAASVASIDAAGQLTNLVLDTGFSLANNKLSLSGIPDGALSGNVSLLGSSIDLSSSEASGTLAAGRFPALTGDVTTSAGGLATTLATGNAGNLNSGTLLAARMPALTGDITTSAGGVATTLATGNAGNLNSGTLLAARMPALTGDITTSAGAVATTLATGNAGNLNSGTLLAARMPALTGDVTTSAGGVATTLATVASAGTYRSVTVNVKGLVTAGTTPTTFAGYGISDSSANLWAALTDLNAAPVTNSSHCIITGGSPSALVQSAGTVGYVGFGTWSSTTQGATTTKPWRCPISGNITNFWIQNDTGMGAGTNAIWFIVTNGVSTGINIKTVGVAGTAFTASNLVDSCRILAGWSVHLGMSNNAAQNPVSQLLNWSCEVRE
jgi:hypothetical protein